MNSIRTISIYDFDGTLANTPSLDNGRLIWEDYYKRQYPHQGWWGRPESLDTNVFNIKLFNTIELLIRKDIADPDTYVVILTSRIEKLRLEFENILSLHDIIVDRVDMKNEEISKGEKVLSYIKDFPHLININVYDDNYEREINSFKSIRNQIHNNVKFNIFHVDRGNLTLIND